MAGRVMRDLEGTDRTVAIINAALGALVMTGLAVSGIWQFLFHDPDWDDHVVGRGRPLVTDPTGMADLHATLADLAAIVTLWITIWVSYRILAGLSRTGIATIVVLVIGIVTGSRIRVNAVVRDGVVDPDATGYAHLFRGDYDYVIADQNDFEPLAAMLWTALHVASLPAVIAMIWFAFHQTERRRRNTPTPDPSWLDRLD